MSEKNLSMIRQSIQLALNSEQQTGELQAYLAALAPKLHKAISLPSDEPSQALMHFVVRYIEQVPEFLEVLNQLLDEAGIRHEAQVFLSIAEEFFLNPPELLQEEAGLKALIDEAYLAHRLIEEVNDRLLMLCGAPLTPMDMTLSNIIIHDLLGEEFANQLDLAVHFAIESLFNPENIAKHQAINAFLNQHDAEHWGKALEKWPCLASDSAISLAFSEPTPSSEVH